MFSISYKKNDNKELFSKLEGKYGFNKIQNYIPIYQKFFSLNDNTYNNINLNHHYSIQNIKEKKGNNIYILSLNDEKQKMTKTSFFKFSPLMDPVKYMVGKYDNVTKEMRTTLPKLNENISMEKILDVNNSAYVDSFFSYLSSIAYHHHKFPNGLDFYGSFLGIQKSHFFNISDDLEYLYDSDYFHKWNGELFKTDDINEELLSDASRTHRKKLSLKGDEIKLEVNIINDDMFGDVFALTEKNLEIHNSKIIEEVLDVSNNGRSRKETESACSSRSSNTSNDTDYEEESDISENSLESCSNSELSEYSSSNRDDEYIKGEVYDFPVQIICLEKMDNTLDSLLDDEDNELSIDEWRSCLFQVSISLIVYQKMYNFTHNDLHSNNIMYIETEKKYLNYRYKNKLYKVPTFGKIYKLIDFGRAIYSHSQKKFMSDSFHPKGDASTQYNTEPYFNEKKPRLEPNYSFDLCRLGCSLFDYFFDDVDDVEEEDDPIALTIARWCQDDKARNVLYKKHGEERYPDFKLYKMIARTVHNHTPENEFDREEGNIFNKFLSSKKKMGGKKAKIFNVDDVPSYV
tara:strand:+ start:29998 stop:31716 length:1719 start_codon:yes stop_codon:yes gene_type:complete